MGNTLLIVKREYLERVRTRSFLLSTVLMPVFMIAMMVVPGHLAELNSAATRHITVVADNPEFASAVKSQLGVGNTRGRKYDVDILTTPSEDVRTRLKAEVSAGRLDGFLWLTNEAVNSRKVTYVARETSDFIELASLQSALKTSLLRQQLVAHGVTGGEVDTLMRDFDLETLGVKRGEERRTSTSAQFITIIILVMLLYMTLFLYGVAVMRSVLEEKTSRVMEVVLSSATPGELMAGKVLGVGAAGLTQILVWIVIAGVSSAPGVLAASAVKTINISWTVAPAFAVFFILGYVLYSAMFAALGAMVNSEQEAQQWQVFITIPILVPILMMTYVIRQPNAPASVWMSMVPFFAPILMYIRVVVQTPAWWQIVLSVALLLATVVGVLTLCARIYRVGILMYGKKPTLPEIVKWIRYA